MRISDWSSDVCSSDLDAPGVIDLGHPLGELAEHAAVVDLLERLALGHVAPDLADEEDHRRRILEGDMDAGAGAGRARPARHEADAGPAGQLAIGIGPHRCATCLAAAGIGDLRRVVEGVEPGEVALPGHAAAAVDAFGAESSGRGTWRERGGQ